MIARPPMTDSIPTPFPRLRIGIDTGGTFTDIVAVDGASGRVAVTKVPSTPHNPALGLVDGVRRILEQTGHAVADLAGLAHGTTVATNALLQGEIDSLGLGYSAAVWEAWYGNAAAATRSAKHVLEAENGRHVRYAAALTLAIVGDRSQALTIAADLATRFPDDTIPR